MSLYHFIRLLVRMNVAVINNVKIMQTIVDTIPLKPGKLEAYKKFTAEITGPRQKEFADLLNRYGLKTVNTSYQTIGGIIFP